MAAKPLLSLTLFSLFATVAISFSHYADSNIAKAPASSVLSSHGSFDLHGFYSFFLRRFEFGSGGSGKLANGFQRGRIVAEIVSNSTADKPALAPSSGNRKIDAGKKNKKKRSKAMDFLAGILLGLTSGAISGLLASLVFRVIHDFWKRPKPNRPVVYQRKYIDAKALAFLESADAMEGLELLGKGGSGEVYKATLENGKVVAIKRVLGLANMNIEGAAVDPNLEKSYDLTKHSAQICAELNTLGQIQHRNLVKLLAYIPKPSAHLLIYEHMENGSLHDALIKVEEDKLELAWSMRLNIAKDIAMGLKYLHFDCSPTIVHCDLKPGNILLDEDMVAHIGDFGLAKIIPDAMTHFTSSNLAGTFGYIPPEYHQTLRYSAKGDVYGYGVILVVLLTGKEPTHHLFSDLYTHMGSWLTDVLASGEENALGILDSRLRGHGDEAEMLLALKVAFFCLKGNPASRPASDNLLKMLNDIRPSSQPYAKIDLPLEAL